MRTRRLATTVLLAGALIVPLSWGAPAVADPAGDTFTLVCGSTTYQVTGPPSRGEFTPAMDLASHRVFIPHSFGAFTGTIRDASGAVVDSFTEPGATQGSGKQKNNLSCTYTFHFVSDGADPDFPAGWTFHGVGTVTGQISH